MFVGGEFYSLEITKEKLEKIKNQRADTQRYAHWMSRYNIEERGKIGVQRVEHMEKCLSFWEWDIYRENKVMDLQKVTRCKDRWCANCRKVARAKSIIEFAPKFAEMRKNGYNPYLLTVTVPNVSGEDLRDTIKKMQKSFRIFWTWFNGAIGKRGYKNRLFRLVAGVRVLEITKNKKTGMFHPHFHCLVFADGTEDEVFFEKVWDGEWSEKRKQYNQLSDADLQIRNIWYRAYNNIRITQKCDEKYICDIRELNGEKGILEVFKYTTKDTDIENYKDFKVLFEALDGLRLKQGLGELYNLKLDGFEEDGMMEDEIENYLQKNSDETPEEIITTFQNLFSKEYHEYKKISRFHVQNVIEKIEG